MVMEELYHLYGDNLQMPASCTIGMELSDGGYLCIPCLHNGSFLEAGPILLKYYSNKKKVKELISLGGLAGLGTTTEKPPEGTRQILDRENQYCFAYFRDCGPEYREHEHLPIYFVDLEQWERLCGKRGFEYLFTNNTWWVLEFGKPQKLMPLKMKLAFLRRELEKNKSKNG